MDSLRRYEVRLAEDDRALIQADRFELGEDWITFHTLHADTGREWQVAAFSVDVVVGVVEVAASLTSRPPEVRADDAKPRRPRRSPAAVVQP